MENQKATVTTSVIEHIKYKFCWCMYTYHFVNSKTVNSLTINTAMEFANPQLRWQK